MSTVKIDSQGLAHAAHYDNHEHEYQTGKQGVWLFLATEVLMFGGLFVGYAIFHHLFPEIFAVGSKFTNWKYGTANTVVLLTSSLTMALGIHFIQVGKQKAAFWNLIVTILCGAIFMGIKYIEYSHKIHLGLMPGSWFTGNPDILAQEIGMSADAIPANLPLYFSFYYMMTGLHGFHVLIGMGAIAWVTWRLKRGDFSTQHYTAVEGVGLFWHLIDLIWIYLFPLLYLV
ncbi:MAG: cytochrome c oxidase subunit 3 family protein [Bdellovibrionota bacterium]